MPNIYLVHHVLALGAPRYNVPTRISDKPVRVFLSQDEAQTYARESHKAGAPFADINPFLVFASSRWGWRVHEDVSVLTSFPEPVYNDWLLELDIPTPTDFPQGEPPIETWIRWFDQTTPNLTEKQIARIWQGLDKVPMFEIVELEVDE